MHSLTKNRKSEASIRVMTGRAFPEAKVLKITEMNQGLFNAAYQVVLTDGKRVVLKIAPAPEVPVMRYEKGIMRAEIQAMALVRQKTDVPVPAVCFSDASHTLCDADYFFMEHLEGERYDLQKSALPPAEKEELEASIGAYNRQINEIPGARFGYPAQPEKQKASWKEAFLLLVDELLLDGEEHAVSLPLPYPAMREVFRECGGCLDEVKQPRLVHWDLWDGNVLVRDHKISGILDFERALWGDPLLEYYFSGRYDNAAFLKGYGENPADRPAAGRRRALYNLYLYLVMMIEYAFRGYESQNQRIWAEGKLRQELRRLKTL